MRRASQTPIVIVAFAALATLLAGCVGIKAGSVALTQPAGVGPAHLRLVLCTLAEKSAEGEEPTTIVCGAPAESGQGQMLLGVMVPVGTTFPESVPAAPGPGAGATTFTRSPEFTAQLNKSELVAGTIGAPAGFEIAGYTSGEISEPNTQELTWTVDANLGLPAGAGGGSYGLPFKASLISGWRKVSSELPIARPINCEEKETVCGGVAAANEATIGVSELKVTAPAPTAVVPGAKVKLPFVLDFATSAPKPPSFKLGATSGLPGAQLSLSSRSFARGPTDPATNRAPATTRKAIVQVPEAARFGSYEVVLTATATQGGAVAAATSIRVGPKGIAKVTVPKLVKAKLASNRGIPVRLVAPIAGTRFLVILRGPGPTGHGKVRLVRKVRVASKVGPIDIGLRVPRPKAEELLTAGDPLTIEAKVIQPGLKKPKRLTRTLTLR